MTVVRAFLTSGEEELTHNYDTNDSLLSNALKPTDITVFGTSFTPDISNVW
jgi:hypothetical protein